MTTSNFILQAGTTKAADVTAQVITQAPGLRAEVLKLALAAAARAEDKGLIPRHDLLTVIDYSLPSSQPRLFCFDLNAHRLHLARTSNRNLPAILLGKRVRGAKEQN